MPNLPPIPVPEHNIDSVLKTLAAMQQYILALHAQTPIVRKSYRDPPNNPPMQPEARWLELSRNTEDVKIVHPDDPDAWVVMERTLQLVMRDQITGEVWVYDRHIQGPTGIAMNRDA